jgi:hypothetical protein
MERRMNWAFATADRIDPRRKAHFIRTFEIDGDAIKMWGAMWGAYDMTKII